MRACTAFEPRAAPTAPAELLSAYLQVAGIEEFQSNVPFETGTIKIIPNRERLQPSLDLRCFLLHNRQIDNHLNIL